jgi:hypothetical protein
VLEAIGDRHELPLELVRGDALRLLGHHGAADEAYLSVAAELRAPTPPASPAAEATGDETPAAVDEPSHEAAGTLAEPGPAPEAATVAFAEPEPAPEAEAAPGEAPEVPGPPERPERPAIRWD